MDPYRVLGVNPQADLKTIRAAYFDLMRRHHPDRAGATAEAADPRRARDLNLAFDLLKDPMRRAAYDRGRAAPRPAAARPSPPHRPASFKPPAGPSLAARSTRLRRVRRFQTALFIGGCLLLAGGAAGLAWVMGPQQTFSAATAEAVVDRVSAAPPPTDGGGLVPVDFSPTGAAPRR